MYSYFFRLAMKKTRIVVRMSDYTICSRVRFLQGFAFSINGSEDLMRRARALVGHFNSSSQASKSLAAVQTRGTNTKPRKVINDCPTRWWSTWKFVKRLRELKVYFGLLVVEGVIDEELNMSDILTTIRAFSFIV